jgi:hypothetical protein
MHRDMYVAQLQNGEDEVLVLSKVRCCNTEHLSLSFDQTGAGRLHRNG